MCYYSFAPLNISHNVLWQAVSRAFPEAECATDILCTMEKNVEKHRHIQQLVQNTGQEGQAGGNEGKPHSGELKYFSMVFGAESGVPLLYPIHSISVIRMSNKNSR